MSATAKPQPALSRINDATRLAAMRLVRTGRLYDLGVELNSRSPGVPGFTPFTLAFTHTPERTAPRGFSMSSDMVTGAIHAGTHIDALVHVQAEGKIFGGADMTAARSDHGWLEQGIETVAPIVGRAVILDAAGHRGVERLSDGEEIGTAEIEAMLKAIDLTITFGDIVLVRTGKIRQWGDLVAFNRGEPGVGREAARWLFEAGMAVLGTDTAATEPTPFRDAANTLHRAMLVEAGVHLIENLDLEAIAADDVHEALFVAAPIKITGATGSWLRPAAIV
jgi:kynurenine formamidase